MLIKPTQDHVEEMMGWFPNEELLSSWAGPNFRYPFDDKTFKNDLMLDQLSSFSLVADSKKFIAFGQYYLRLNRCHLCRLVVKPSLRGTGIAKRLMQCLCRYGCNEFKTNECSLFVLSHNERALKSYTSFGFTVSEYPKENPMKNCIYMVKFMSI